MKIAEVLVVEDFSGKKINEEKVKEAIMEMKKNNVENVIVSTIHIPKWDTEDNDILGIHIIVREVAET